MSKLVTIVSFDRQFKAQIAVSSLMNAGITVFNKGELVGQTFSLESVGGLEIQVPKDQKDKALQWKVK